MRVNAIPLPVLVLEGVVIELDRSETERLQRIMAENDNGIIGGTAHDLNGKLTKILKVHGIHAYEPKNRVVKS